MNSNNYSVTNSGLPGTYIAYKSLISARAPILVKRTNKRTFERTPTLYSTRTHFSSLFTD